MSASSFVFKTALAVSLAMTLVGGVPAEAQWPGLDVWSATGSAGVVAESSTSLVAFDSVGASFRATAAAGSLATIRYPVASLSAGFVGTAPNGVCMPITSRSCSGSRTPPTTRESSACRCCPTEQ